MATELEAIFPYIKDLGLPIVALFYIFKMYQERVKKGDEREDRYATIMAEHAKSHTEVCESIKTLTTEIREERKTLLDSLITLAKDNK